MSGLRGVTSGLQCVLLRSDGSSAATGLHRQLVLYLPLAYIAVQGVLCPRLLLYDSPSSVVKPPGLNRRVILVTWQPPSSEDLEKISCYFNGSIFLWVSEINGAGEKYLTFEDRSLKEIDETAAASIFKVKRMAHLPDYKQKIFTIAVANYSTYSQAAQQDEHGIYRWIKGFQLMYFILLCKSVGLRPVVTLYKRWDSFHKNGSVKLFGIQSLVARGEVDGAVGGIWYRHHTVGLVDMMMPLGNGCLRYLIPRPKRVNLSWTLFLGVFNRWIWILIAVFVIIVSVMLTVMEKLSLNPKLQQRCKSLGHTVFLVISILVQAPQIRQDWRGAQVPIFYSWVLTTMILATAFGGSFSAILVRPAYEERPKSFRDLLDKGYTYGLPYNVTGFKTIFDDNLSDDWKAWTYGRFRLCTSFEETVERMKMGKFVVSGELVHGIFFFHGSGLPPDDLLAKFEINGQCHQHFQTGGILPAGSPYSPVLNMVDARLRSGGITHAFIRSYLRFEPALHQFVPYADLRPSTDYNNSATPLCLGSLMSVFMVFAIGILLATCTFFIELVLGSSK